MAIVQIMHYVREHAIYKQLCKSMKTIMLWSLQGRSYCVHFDACSEILAQPTELAQVPLTGTSPGIIAWTQRIP
jgi:hypothetical protein